MSSNDHLLQHIGAMFALEGEKIRSEWAAGLAETQRGLRITGSRYATLPGDAASRLLSSGSGRLIGWSVLASAGPVRLVFHDGRDATGDVCAILDLADKEHDNMAFTGGGISFTEGLFVECSGTGTALIGAAHLAPAA